MVRKLFEKRWPDGEPALLANGVRWGTRLPDGTVIVADGFTFTPLNEGTMRYTVETVDDAWSYINGPDGYREGPYRYRWEAEECAGMLERGELQPDELLSIHYSGR